MHPVSSLIRSYFESIAHLLQVGHTTKHFYHSPLQSLLGGLLPSCHLIYEPQRVACGAPDFELIKDGKSMGYIQTTDVGMNLEKVQETEQIKGYLHALNHLLLTNYIEFRWFVEGEYQRDMTVELARLDKQGQLKLIFSSSRQLEVLLKSFVTVSTNILRNPEKLAKKMAHLAQLMNKVILKAYQQEEKEGPLHKRLEHFRHLLTKTLTPEQFTDMVAQTIGYGLFVVKCSGHHFSRLTANCFTQTGPFLRNLFDQLTGIESDERLGWIVSHWITVLNQVDIDAIVEHFGQQTHQVDPIVHIYEIFLAHYDANLRIVRGVYYTPEPVVSYIVRSVDAVLKRQFWLKRGLADQTQLDHALHQVHIFDPALGMGTFLYVVIAKIYEQFHSHQDRWSEYVAKHLLPRLHGFEVLMPTYAMAHLKLSLQLKKTGYDFGNEEPLQLFLTNTLDNPHYLETSWLARWLSQAADASHGIKQNCPVMVIVGNPPYSGHSANTGTWMNDLLRGIGDQANYFSVDGQPLKERNPKWLNDDYVKFIRFAQWCIQQAGHGVLGFVTNHSYLDNPTFRGMRQALMQDFDDIYILNLHGNSKKKEKSPDGSIDQNVFDIQQGVAIGLFIKHRKKNRLDLAQVYHAHVLGERTFKYQYLTEHDIETTSWTLLQPRSPFYLFVPQRVDCLAEYEAGWNITELMPVNSVGIVTARDHLTVHTSPESLIKTLKDFSQLGVEEARNQYDLGKDVRDWKVHWAQNDIKEHGITETYVVPMMYRPFDVRFTFYTGRSRGLICMPRIEVMQHMLYGGNLGFITIRHSRSSEIWKEVFVSKYIVSGATSISSLDINYFFPLYLYPSGVDHFLSGHASGSGQHKALSRKPNFSDQFIQSLESRLTLKFIAEGDGDFIQTISALDVFNYMYAVFHSSMYRQRYAEFLKMDFPRLPFTRDKDLFKHLAVLGAQLVKIHLMERELEPYCSFPIQGYNVVEKIIYQDEKVYINKTQYFGQIKPEIWTFQIGGYQVCEKWLKDRKGQRLSFDERSHYLFILAAVEHTQMLMNEIDAIIGVLPLL